MNYYKGLIQAREDSRKEFFSQDPTYSTIITLIQELLPQVILSIEKECSISKYEQALLASFLRTTFVSIDLIINSELIEAVTLLRKQIELLARLRELDTHEHEKLIKKTPNIKHLKTKLKKLYSTFSENSHSATYASHSLLGFYENTERKNHIIYPEFTRNTEVIFENWIFVFFEFSLWALDYKSMNIDKYSKEEDESNYMKIIYIYDNSTLKDKFTGKHGN